MAPHRSEAEWVAIARSQLTNLLDSQAVLSEPEAICRLVDQRLVAGFEAVSPHHVTQAKNLMARRNQLRIDTSVARGGRVVSLLVSVSPELSRKVVDSALSRKRLLMARYHGWTQGTVALGPGLIGPEGEWVVERTLRDAGVGAVLTKPGAGTLPGLKNFLGIEVPAGPLDNGLVLNPLHPDGSPRAQLAVAVPVEVKNVREWIYPHSQELHQLLYKSAAMKAINPGLAIVPLLVCRRAHITTSYMAKRLGFFVAQTKRHYFPAHSRITPEAFAEVRSELGLLDMVQGLDVCDNLRARLVTMQQHYDVETAAAVWGRVSEVPEIVDVLESLFREGTAVLRRRKMNLLRSLTEGIGISKGW